MKKIIIGIVAHVDAGKTTLTEAMLYKTGTIRKPGRVDHGDAFLDTDIREKARGITIFSKQAEMQYGETSFMLVDTPGHVDFSSEMERALQVLDYGLLVINGNEGIQGHTATLWRLLRKYGIPVFIFVNKMDLDGADKTKLIKELKTRLDEGCLDFCAERDGSWNEEAAMCDDMLLEEFLKREKISNASLAKAIGDRKIFPCYFGSALKIEGVDELLKGMDEFCTEKTYPDAFGARVYKISRDDRGERLTHMKITGGKLHVKDKVKTSSKAGDEGTDQGKIEQIRIYSGADYRNVDEITAGNICAVTGLNDTYAGQGLGTEEEGPMPEMEAALLYSVILPEGQDEHEAFDRLKLLEEEDPQLAVIWDQRLQEIQIKLMGEVQQEILKNIIKDRFGFDVEFGEGKIMYKETIDTEAVGAGHFEPLRHYAEVQLLLKPGKRGSGMVFDSACSEDDLDRNWQRLIMTHLEEKEHLGVLTGSPVTDMEITLLTGKAHLKHTEGGDFRQATYRAVRQGLMKAHGVLLEPWYGFHMEIPPENVGRAMSDIRKMGGTFREPETAGDMTILEGRAPVSGMKDYFMEFIAYTGGHGRLSCVLDGYDRCHDEEEVIERIGYDPESDAENTADSVFCANGAGYTVKWNEADEHMHTEVYGYGEDKARGGANLNSPDTYRAADAAHRRRGDENEEEELERIFEMTYGKKENNRVIQHREVPAKKDKIPTKPVNTLEEYLVVDGYNIIFGWKDLNALSKVNLDAAREALIEILSNYQGYKKCNVMVIFDAYKIKGGERRYERHENVEVVYTEEAETADMYIEKFAHKNGKDYHVRVATSDRLEQTIVTGAGAFKISADEFRMEVEQADTEIAKLIEEINRTNKRENRQGIVIPEDDKE